METPQEYIDNLIIYIDEAVARASVSNRHVAAVLDYLNRRLKSLPEICSHFSKDADHNVKFDDHEIAYLTDLVKFLRKDVPDAAAALITFLMGAKFGDYIPGLTGRGAYIDDNGDAEFGSLIIRKFIEVQEFRCNRVSVIMGNQWRSPGGGLIERVTVDTDIYGNPLNTGIITLHLEDGEFGAVAVDDICMGSFHMLDTSANAVQDMDDSRGNFMLTGFATCYFRVTSILTPDCSQFTYQLRGVSDRWTAQNHPAAQMNFVAYGNFTDATRQVSRYSTRTYERYLAGVNTWEFQPGNIMAQFGDLSNLDVFGLNMSGYSCYLNNIYMSGTIQQIENAALRISSETDGDGFLDWGEDSTWVFHVWKGGYLEDITDQVTRWSITRDSGYPAEDAAWLNKAKVRNFNGTITIAFKADDNDLASLSSTISTLFTVTAWVGTRSVQRQYLI